MSQKPLEMAGRKVAAQEEGCCVEGMHVFQNREDEGSEPSLGSGCNSTSDTKT